jgi:RimJ/RimL family protein N-acetyltransferase
VLDRQPVLAGEHVRLRPLRGEDWDALFAVAADPLIWAQHPAHDRWQEPVFRPFFDDALANQGALIALDAQSGAVIGSSRYQGLEDAANGGSVEIGWSFLARSHLWGSGANAEMKRLMLTHALASVERAFFVVGEGNVISRRAMTKIGGRLTEETRDISRAGVVQRHVVFEIDRAGFANGPLSA